LDEQVLPLDPEELCEPDPSPFELLDPDCEPDEPAGPEFAGATMDEVGLAAAALVTTPRIGGLEMEGIEIDGMEKLGMEMEMLGMPTLAVVVGACVVAGALETWLEAAAAEEEGGGVIAELEWTVGAAVAAVLAEADEAAGVLPPVLTGAGPTIDPVAVGESPVYAKTGEIRLGEVLSAKIVAFFPNGWTGLFPGSLRSVPVVCSSIDLVMRQVLPWFMSKIPWLTQQVGSPKGLQWQLSTAFCKTPLSQPLMKSAWYP